MSNRIQSALLLMVAICCLGTARVSAQRATPSPTPTSLNNIRIGQCGVAPTEDNSWLEYWIRAERERGSVLDARPFAINQTTGKLSFNGSTGRVSVVNMNPFVYKYKITVAQEELVSTAITDFLKLILPESLRSNVGIQSGGDTLTASKVTPTTKLTLIAERLKDFEKSKCYMPTDPLSKTAACIAVSEMYSVFKTIKNTPLISASGAAELSFTVNTSTSGGNVTSNIEPSKIRSGGSLTLVNQEFAAYTQGTNDLRDEEADAYTICDRAQKLRDKLSEFDYQGYFDQLDLAQKAIAEVNVYATDLESLVTAFKADEELSKAGKDIRCKGFNCVEQFDAYAKEVRSVLGTYTTELNRLRKNVKEMQDMLLLTNQMKDKDGLFARTFTIIKKFELSQATVSVNREKLKTEEAQKNASGPQSGDPNSGGTGGPQPELVGGNSGEGSGLTSNSSGNNFGASGNQSGMADGGASPPAKEPDKGQANNLASTGQINEVIQIGRPRFVLSGGLVYSPLPRRTFKSVKGFKHDAQGNPTGDGNANVVGYDENSSRRLLPMVLLNSRLLSGERASLYFSFGVTAKNDDNMDVEYLFGPSVGLLNDRALFTFGVYGGKSQNLVSDVAIGDELPDTIGDAKLFRKSYVWKPGFSFSYSFSRTKKKTVAGSTTTGSPANDLKNEIRIGNIPFNLALGLAYTSLEQRTYDEVVGFARDRQSNLTNGRTLTRIVGLTSSSNYRLTPVVMLHSRLTNFGRHDFYFSTGVTGKKTDNAFDIEYLLGGSTNLYQRKVFLTVGAFVGKQQILGGDFFEGAKLGTSQNVTTQNRYVWKPAISISYDISKIIPRP